MILFTDQDLIPNECRLINLLFDAGLETLHLRKPNADELQMAQKISEIDEKYHSKIMIHSHYQLMNSFGLKGLHFTEKTKPDIQKYDHIECVKSKGIHTLMELNYVEQSIDYLFLSPIFPSVSKQGYSEQWDFDEIKDQLSQKRRFKVCALGGVGIDKVKQIKTMGFDDYAVLGSIWLPFKQKESVEKILERFKQFRNEE